MMMALLWFLALLPVALGELSHHDPLTLGQTFIAGSTDPTQGSTAWALTSHGIAEKLFTVDEDGNIVPQVGESVTRLDDLSWEVKIKSGYSFSDGTGVTAQHVANAFTQLNQVNTNAQSSLGAMTVTALDSLTLKIESERATPVMMAVLAEWPFVVYLVKDGMRYFTGPFVVETFVEGDRFELKPNPHYPRAAERAPLVIKRFPDGQSVATALEQGDVDMGFHLPVDLLSDLRAHNHLTIKSFLVGYQYMMFYNTRRAPLSDLQVRKAFDMALDRQALSQELRGGRATRNMFPENTPYALTQSELNGDRNGAEALLDQAGWIKNASGIRNKNGVPLSVDLVAYPQRPGLVIMQPVIQQTLEALGVVVNAIVTSGENWDELDAITDSKNFDLLLWAQHTLPAGDPQWFLNAFFRSTEGRNNAGLNSPAIDTLLDNLGQADESAARKSATEAAHNAILQEVPVSMIVTPEWHVGLGNRMSSYMPWGSDYYIVRADFGLDPLETSTTMVMASSTDRAMSSKLALASLWLFGLRQWMLA